MHHEEKMIDGVLHWRGTPDGEWTPYTLEGLSARHVELQKRAAVLEQHKQSHPCWGADCVYHR